MDIVYLLVGIGFFAAMAGYARWAAKAWAMLDLILGSSVALGLLAYLVFALVRPEKF